MLTPAYSSPEQLRGDPVTTAADVYSLGVLSYQLLAGAHPFPCDTADPLALLRAMDAVAPSNPAALNKALAGDIANVLMKAVDKEPDRRYAGVDEFDEDLRRCLAGEPVRARPASLTYRVSRFVGRNRLMVAAASLAVLSLVALAAAAVWQARQAGAAARRAGAINRFVTEMLGAPDPGKDGRTVTVAEVLDRAAARLPVDLAADSESRAAIRATLARSYHGLGLYPQARGQLEAAILEEARRHGADSIPVAMLELELGEVDEAEGKPGDALLRFQAAGNKLRKQGAPNEDVARALNASGGTLLALGRLDEAEQAHRNALKLIDGRGGRQSALRAEAINDLAVVLSGLGRREEAIAAHRESLAIARAVFPGNHPALAGAISTLAAALTQTAPSESEKLFLEAIDSRTRALGPEHPDLAWSRYNYAHLLMEQKRFDEAAEQCRRVLENRGKTLSGEHPMVAASLQVLGRCRRSLGDPIGALPLLQESLDLRLRTLPPGLWLLDSSRSILGECLVAAGRPREGRPMMAESYQSLLRRFGPQHEQTRMARERLDAASR
jgi:serine/threonine-protein kinase